MITNMGRVVLFSAGAAVLVGCAARDAGLPVGHWRGEGTAIYVEQSKKNDDYGLDRSVWGAYPTKLKIERLAAEPHERLRLEIHSGKGTLELDEREATWLVVVLDEAWRSRDGRARCYRLVEFGVSTDGMPPKLERAENGPVYASLMSAGDTRVLQIHYGEGYEDTIEFRGSQVDKVGSFTSHEEAKWIRWCENLRRTDKDAPL